MAYRHRITTTEMPTQLITPNESNAALRVVVGTAPINMAEDAALVNTPVLIRSFEEGVKKFGYSDDYRKFTLSEALDVTFKVFNITPIVFINVLDPKKHRKDMAEVTVAVVKRRATVDVQGIILPELVVKNGETVLAAGTDYVTAFNAEGGLEITLLSTQEGAQQLKVSGAVIDQTLVTDADIIGGIDAASGMESGIEAIRKVYPVTGMVPGLLLAPGFSKSTGVAAALMTKTEELNGLFSCECVLDMDTSRARVYSELKTKKDEFGVSGSHAILCWPMLRLNGKIYNFSIVWAAMAVQCDVEHGDVPYKSPSNEPLKMSAAVLADGTAVHLDIPQAEAVNANGIVTAIFDGQLKSYGNNTSAYPLSTDPKDRWIACRRMMSWYRNHFILTFRDKVDEPRDLRLIESIVDSENIYLNSLKAAGNIPDGKIHFYAAENTTDGVLNGQLKFHTNIAYWIPTEYIEDVIEFDTSMLTSALGGE